MSLFSASNLSKKINDSYLFEGVAFGMEYGEKVSVIGKNGVGKTTFLRCIAGVEIPDTGNVSFNREVKYEFLEQLPQFIKNATVLQTVMNGKQEIANLLRVHAELCEKNNLTETEQNELHTISAKLDETNGWRLDTEAETILTKLGIDIFDADVTRLSGGQRKRVAIARALISEPDLIILDEPTNHLDTDSVQWLQDYVQRSNLGLLLVTHDRYFLDAVSTRIIELDKQKIFSYPGNFEKYLERKEAMIASEEAQAEHLRNKLRNELVWLQRGAQARRTKQQSRIDWIAKMKAEPPPKEERNIRIEFGSKIQGGIVINCHNISKSIGEKLLFKEFTYYAAPGDRIGIIGPNGSGKSTLLNVMAGLTETDTGSVKIGETTVIGYFKQEQTDLPLKQSVIATLREIAEFIDVGVGRENYISARELLERFLFPPNRHYTLIENLSGGERRRLALLCVLMKNPNVLLLDEPTNDFDIATLSALEEFLQYFKGTLITVSHDRSFLDKTVNFVYVFQKDGSIKQYPGNYSFYLEKIEQNALEQKAQEIKAQEQAEKNNNQRANATNSHNNTLSKASQDDNKKKEGLTFSEKFLLKDLEKKIEILEKQKAEATDLLNNCDVSDYQFIAKQAEVVAAIENELNSVIDQWAELMEKEIS